MPIIREVDSFKYPGRKPWLFLLILLVCVVAGIWLFKVRKNLKVKKESPVAISSPVDLAVAPVVSTTPEQRVEMPEKKAVDDANMSALLKRVGDFEKAGNFLEARKSLLTILDRVQDSKTRQDVEARLGRANIRLAFNPVSMPEKIDYVVVRGDSIEKIAKKHHVTSEFLAASNHLKNPNLIRPGDRLKVLSGDIKLFVNKRQNTLLLSLNGRFFKRYSVGTGRGGKTPSGTFVISDRIPEPPWTKDGKVIPYGDKANILGTRWMAIKATGNTPDFKGFGIHGTWDESSIGQALSDGCVRMRNSDVEELFMLVTVGTPVTIVD